MSKKTLIVGYLVLLFFLHQDFWLKDNPALIFGFLPATLAYHMGFTIAAALGWWMIVKFAWPEELDSGPAHDEQASGKEGSGS